jgi:CRP/FNR family cyclic AMP-dependent transcriptional regulator
MSVDTGILAEIPMFELLDENERKSLAALLEPVSFTKGEAIFGFGDAGDSVYIIHRGRVQVWVENNEGNKIVLAENEPGELFGEISLLDGGPRTANAIAVEDTDAFVLDRDQLLRFVTNNPHAAIDLLTVMGRRLRATDELLRTQVSRNLNEEEEEMLTFGQRIADQVAVFGGSWTFIISFGVFLAVWMAFNVWLGKRAFDEYPFILLNLCLSTLAALQAPVIMMSQNRQASKDRLKADLDYEVNLKAELEVAQLHNKIDRLYERLEIHFAKAERNLRSNSAEARN